MAYLVLARKWRPRAFDEVIGQEYITKTLRNAVLSNKLAHALIFSGPRGVGKTSTARIVAKSLNCDKGPTPDPCQTCVFCKEISDGISLDVIEIDAASHTGVKDIREIIENIRYLPSLGKTKIYIIDEAHMLSQAAFNALLKTLEEPPPHVIFILATTEVHKIPVTILSRCQRFDFKKVPLEKIRERIKLITSIENIVIADDTIDVISKESDGSIRDALSLLDQLIATFGSNISYEDSIRILGILDRSLIRNTISAIFKEDPKTCIEILNEACEKGVSPKRFAEDVLKMLRNALIIKTCGNEMASGISIFDKKEIEEISADQSTETLEMLFNLMLQGTEIVQKSPYPQMALEMTLVKLTMLKSTVPLDEILDRIENLYKIVSTNNTIFSNNPVSKTQHENKSSDDAHENVPNKHSEKNQLHSDTSRREIPTQNEIIPFIEYLKVKKPMIATHMEHVECVITEDSTIEITVPTQSIHFDYLIRKDIQEFIKTLSKEYFGKDFRIKIHEKSLTASETSIKETNNNIREKIKNNPVVQDALEIFNGRIVNLKINVKE
ncbi:MAG: DNA polymerase III subunit gamma/tau [Thermodesulfobacteriota bacterium]